MFQLNVNMRIADFNNKYTYNLQKNSTTFANKQRRKHSEYCWTSLYTQNYMEPNLSFAVNKFEKLNPAIIEEKQCSVFKNQPNYKAYLYNKISFGALKKTNFNGINLAVVEKFKAPIEKFKTNDDLQNWAKEEAETIVHKDLGGRTKETRRQRRIMHKEWSDYVFKENKNYNSAVALLILNAVTKDMKSNSDKLLPAINKDVLAECVEEIDKKTKEDTKYQFDLSKMYETKLRLSYIDDKKKKERHTGWVVIQSQINDSENFEKNVEKLKTLSHKNWCTKSYNAKPYLSVGDFHVYLEDGQPKIGIRFIRDKIQEIEGEENNTKIPLAYFEEVEKHIAENNLKLAWNAQKEIESAEEAKEKMEKAKTDLKTAIENKNAKAIFQYFGIETLADKDGFFAISEYRQPSDYYSFSELGIDENMLFEKVKRIEKSASFTDSQLKSLKNLEYIGGNAHFEYSKVKYLGNLKYIGGNADFYRSQVIDLGNLGIIAGHADFQNSEITNLANLKIIYGSADFRKSNVTSLGSLEYIGGSADFSNSQVTDLGDLKLINGWADFSNSKVTCLSKLEKIGGVANFKDSQITDFGKLKLVNGMPCI